MKKDEQSLRTMVRCKAHEIRSFHELVKKTRPLYGSTRKICKLLGVSRETFSRMERGEEIALGTANSVLRSLKLSFGRDYDFHKWFEIGTVDKSPAIIVPTLSVDGTEVPNIRVIQSFTAWGGITPLTRRGALRFEYLGDEPVAVPDDLKQHKEDFLNTFKGKRGVLSNDPSYRFKGLHIERYIDKNASLKERRRVFIVRVAKGFYFDFLWPNTVLDHSVELGGRLTTLRTEFETRMACSLKGPDIHVEDLERFNIGACRIGCNVIFVTSDNYVIVSMRSSHPAIASGGFHVSVAEGMLFGKDVEKEGGTRPSIFATCVRALGDELGLMVGIDYFKKDLRCLYFLLDTQRLQPFFVLMVHGKVPMAAVRKTWESNAKDQWENSGLMGVPWDEDHARMLARGRLELPGSEFLTAASNHAHASFVAVARNAFSIGD